MSIFKTEIFSFWIPNINDILLTKWKRQIKLTFMQNWLEHYLIGTSGSTYVAIIFFYMDSRNEKWPKNWKQIVHPKKFSILDIALHESWVHNHKHLEVIQNSYVTTNQNQEKPFFCEFCLWWNNRMLIVSKYNRHIKGEDIPATPKGKRNKIYHRKCNSLIQKQTVKSLHFLFRKYQ